MENIFNNIFNMRKYNIFFCNAKRNINLKIFFKWAMWPIIILYCLLKFWGGGGVSVDLAFLNFFMQKISYGHFN